MYCKLRDAIDDGRVFESPTITRRCTQRQFLLCPDPAINNAFIYCLAEAAVLTEPHDIIDKMAYAHANPCAAD